MASTGHLVLQLTPKAVSHQHNALAMRPWGSLNIWTLRILGESSATFSGTAGQDWLPIYKEMEAQ